MAFEMADAGNALLGVATAVGVAAVMGAVTLRLRRTVYERAKQTPVRPPFALPEFAVSRTPQQLAEDRAASQALRAHHDRGRALQDSTVAYLVAASSTLFVAFAGSVAGISIWRAWEPFHLYSACLDVAALVVVIGAFRLSGRRRAQWIRERALSEFIRQRNSTEFLLARTPGVVTAPYEAFVSRTKEALDDASRPLIETIAAYGRTRVEDIRAAVGGAAMISKADLRFYLRSRPIYQAGWFERSRRRIHHQNEHRAAIMAWLFGLALAAAVTKLVATLQHAEAVSEWAVLVLMLAIGVGTAMTSAYVGQNLRSLRHRYGAQVRAIELWFEDYEDVMTFAHTEKPLTKAQQARLARAVGAFEALMVAELVDWVSISIDDVMELAPA